MSFRSERIESRHNERIKAARALHRAKGRRERGAWLLEGRHLLDEALQGRCRVCEVFYTAEWAEADETEGCRRLERLADAQPQTRYYEVTERVMTVLGPSETPQGILLVVEAPGGWSSRSKGKGRFREAGRSVWQDLWKGPDPLVVVGDALQDPGNVGTIIRSAAAAGVAGVVLTEGSVDPGNPKVLRATAGTVFRIPMLSGVPVPAVWEEAAAREIPVYLLEAVGGSHYAECDLSRAAIVVVGNETHGPSSITRGTGGQVLAIPMARGVESLNAGVAASIVLFEAARQRNVRGLSPEIGL